MVPFVILWFLTMVFGLVLFFMTSGNDNQMEEEIDRKIDFQIQDIRKRSVITLTMNDHISRDPSIGDRYEDRKAFKIISHYFSTPADEDIYIDGQEISQSQVRNDIESYLRFKMEKYWGSGSIKADYYLKISQDNSGSKPGELVVRKDDYFPEAKWSALNHQIRLADGSAAQVILWTKTSRGVYGVGG